MIPINAATESVLAVDDLSAFGQDPWWIVVIKALGIFVLLVVLTLFNIWFERRVVARAEGGGVGAVGAKVVVDHVEENGQPEAMCGIDEPPQVVGASVGARRGEERSVVVATAPPARKVGDGHQLHDGDAELDQVEHAHLVALADLVHGVLERHLGAGGHHSRRVRQQSEPLRSRARA